MLSNRTSFGGESASTRQMLMSKASIRTNLFLAELDDLDQNYSTTDLRYFQSSLFATVLEDTICQLRILDECNNAEHVSKTISDMVALLARKYEVPEKTIGDPLDDINPKRLQCIEYKRQKMVDDRNYLHDTLVGTYVNLSLNRRSKYLTDHVDEALGNINYRASLFEEEARNRVLRRDLNRQLRHQRNHIKSVLYDTNIVIQNLKTNVEDAGLNTRIRGRYVDNWQVARTEQHLQTIYDKEVGPLDAIMHFKVRADQEQRVHTEIELLTNISINETLQKIEDWMSKYDIDMEEIDLKIQKKRNQLDDMIKRNEDLEKTIEEHALLVKNWVTFKEEREQARLYREKMNDAAVCIQAWWRGLLVRYQLGPYKPVKKRPAPDTGKGKKKK